jgi:hypothetical protein
MLLNTKVAATATSSRSTDQTKIPATPKKNFPPCMGFPSPPSFESDVHPEQLLFLEFHAEKRTLGGRENRNKMGGKDGWVDGEKKSTEKNLQ